VIDPNIVKTDMLSEKTKAKLIGLDPNSPNSWDPVYIDPFDPSHVEGGGIRGKNLVPKKPVLSSNPYPIALDKSICPANGWLLYEVIALEGTAYMLDGKLVDPTMMEQKMKLLLEPEAPDSGGTRWDWLMF